MSAPPRRRRFSGAAALAAPSPRYPPRSSSLSLLHRPLGLLGMAAARAPRAFVRSQERSRGQQVHSRPGSASFGRAGICLAGDRAPARHRGLLKTRGFQSTATARAVRAALDSCGGPGRSAVASRSALLRRSTPRRLSCKNPAEQCAEHTAPLDRRAQACSFSFCLSQSLHPTSPPAPARALPSHPPPLPRLTPESSPSPPPPGPRGLLCRAAPVAPRPPCAPARQAEPTRAAAGKAWRAWARDTHPYWIALSTWERTSCSDSGS